MSLISVVTPTYNGAKYLKSTIESILNQTYKDIEMIVVVDGSTDDTIAILDSIKDDRLRYFVNDENKGISYSTNRCFKEARGEYIAICDHDDMSLPNRLQLQHDFLKSNPDIDGCYGRDYIIGADEFGFVVDEDREPIVCNSESVSFVKQIFGFVVVNPTTMFNRRVIDKMDKWFDESISVAADIHFYESAFNSGLTRWVGLENTLIQYRRHPESATSSKRKIIKQEAYTPSKRAMKRIYPNITDKQLQLHDAYLRKDRFISKEDNMLVFSLLSEVFSSIANGELCDIETLRYEMERYWSATCSLSHPLNPFKAYDEYLKLPEDMGGGRMSSFSKFLNSWQKIVVNATLRKLRR